MTATPPDPDPDRTPGLGLEPGGGVRPGDTPPESGSTTRGLSRRERYPSRALPMITLVFVIIVLLAVVAFTVISLLGIVKVF
ncbi:DUF6480 family protein [Actinokineospora iranica]|uniref:Uncharacterized protein n=1 Tax=Actinokineospora iranica TaxID=1271860 RepID=A0A1G6RVF8_9PSEU|nr:DUF6480 family protein [Actinokineospora iranica]SDD08384.1 hypothetical protein SAMN05216174_10740 [Actinokineospora iranica]